MPEPLVAIRRQLSVGRQPLERRVLEKSVVALDVVEHLRLQHEESAIDPPLTDLRLLREFGDKVAVENQSTKTRRRTNRGDGSQFAVASMEFQQGARVDAAHTITVRHHERLTTEHVREPTEASASLRLEARIAQVDYPVLGIGFLYLDLVRTQIDTETT